MSEQNTPLRGSAYSRMEQVFGPERVKGFSNTELIDAYRTFGGDDLTTLLGTPEQRAKAQAKQSELFEGLLMRRAEQAQKLGKESAREAFKYEMLGRLPETIANAAYAPGIIAAQGAGNIANMMAQGAQNIPSLTRFDRGSYRYTPTRYFN